MNTTPLIEVLKTGFAGLQENQSLALRYPHEFTLPRMSRSSLIKELAPVLTLRQTTQRRHSGRRFGREI